MSNPAKPTSLTWFWISLLALTAVRMVIGAVNELSADETYYYQWTRHLDWSYYSKGPGVASTIWFTTSILGDNSLGVRVLSPLLGLGSSVLLFRLGCHLFDRRSAVWAVALLNLTPIFNAGSIVLTIDPLMMFFWVAAMLSFWHATRPGASLKPWLLTGLLLGIGFLAKYTIALVLISILLFLRLRPNAPPAKQTRRGYWAMIGTFLLCTAPVFIWNAQNNWITFRHLAERAGLIPRLVQNSAPKDDSGFFNPLELLEYLGLHTGVYSPIFFIGLMVIFVLSFPNFRRSEAWSWTGAFGIPVVLMYFILSLKTAGEVNWTAPGLLAFGLALPAWYRDWNVSQKLKTGLASVAIGLSILMTLFACNPDLFRAAGVSWSYEKDPFGRLRGWRTIADEVEPYLEEIRQETGKTPFLVGNRYQVAAALAFYLDEDAKVHRPSPDHPIAHMIAPENREARQNQFSFWPRYFNDPTGNWGEEFLGRPAIYVTDQPRRENPPDHFVAQFPEDDVRLVGLIEVRRRGDLLHEWRIFACYNFQDTPMKQADGE